MDKGKVRVSYEEKDGELMGSTTPTWINLHMQKDRRIEERKSILTKEQRGGKESHMKLTRKDKEGHRRKGKGSQTR